MSSPTTAPAVGDPTHQAFQPAIQGLRALAVLGVLAFHVDDDVLPGGFTGVDIFFVISGYLISRNILRDTEAGTFSFAAFYTRRMRRILPALIVTVFATFVAGCLFLSPAGLKNLAKESTHALVSISNYQYWRESHDYFGVAAHRQILLHVWSLSLEEQFYLIWPAFLVLSARFRSVGAAILLATLVSFMAGVVWHMRDPSAAFFLTPFRVFQFGIGASLVFAERYRKRHALISPASVAVSLLGIAASFVCMTPQAPYPVLTLLPALSAAGIILSGGASRFDAILTNRPMQLIGAISYSLYLCHWPAIYFVRLMMPQAGDAGLAVAAITVSFGLAALMYVFIEQPFRVIVLPSGPTFAQAARLVAPLIAPIVTGALAMQLVYRTGGMEWRLTSAQTEFAERLDEPWDDCEGQAGLACIFGDRESARNVLLLGDSMTRNYVAGLDVLLAREHVRGRSLRLGGCPMIPGVRLINNPQRRIERCGEETETAAAALAADDRLLVIGQNWEAYSDGFIAIDGEPVGSTRRFRKMQAAIEAFIASRPADTRFLLIGGIVVTTCGDDLADQMPAPFRSPRPSACPPKPAPEARRQSRDVDSMLRAIRRKWPDRVTLLLPSELYCGPDMCVTSVDGMALFRDIIHFTRYGSEYFTNLARPKFEAFLAR